MGIQSLAYTWESRYRGGIVLKQFDREKELLFKEIDQSKLESFAWIPSDSSRPSFTLKLQPWQRLIAARVNRIGTNTRTGKREHLITYLLGWQANIDGRNYKSINYILPDGNVIIGEE